MSIIMEQIKAQVNNLSDTEKAELAYFFLTSLEPEEEGVEESWRIEIARRVAEIKSGQAVGRPAEEILDELRERYP